MLGWGSLYNGRQSNGRCNRASGDHQTIEAELKPPSSDHYPRDATREASNRMG